VTPAREDVCESYSAYMHSAIKRIRRRRPRFTLPIHRTLRSYCDAADNL